MVESYPEFVPYSKPVYVSLTIDNVIHTDPLFITVERNIGEFNATSSFVAEFNNFVGSHHDLFSLNDDIIIKADAGLTTPTTVIFKGIIEHIKFKGSPDDEKIEISGRDYGAVLQDMTVSPIIYKNKDAGVIARTIIINNTENIISVNNINITTGITIDKIGFNHKSVFDSLTELAELAGCYFYVDVDKDVHFQLKSSSDSFRTFNNQNVYDASFRVDDREVYNKVWVYGDRILTGNIESFSADGVGSKFTLLDKPHNTRVTSHSVFITPGGILTMDDPATKNVKYLVDFNEKQIIFTSGTSAGVNIPASGTLPVSIEYEKTNPLLSYISDSTSITSYGPKSKIISDPNLKSYDEVNDKAVSFLADYKDPKIQGTIYLKGLIDLTPGQTCIVNLPWHGIDYQTYTILSVCYSFNPYNNNSGRVMNIEVNKKINDFTDTVKSILNKTKNLELGALEGDFTVLNISTENVLVDEHYEIYIHPIGTNFVFHSAKHGLLEDLNSRIGTGGLGSTLIESGGYIS